MSVEDEWQIEQLHIIRKSIWLHFLQSNRCDNNCVVVIFSTHVHRLLNRTHMDADDNDNELSFNVTYFIEPIVRGWRGEGGGRFREFGPFLTFSYAFTGWLIASKLNPHLVYLVSFDFQRLTFKYMKSKSHA